MEIISGLNNSAVQRLKRLWVGLPDRFLRLFEEMEETMMPQNNFKNYYAEINKRISSPCVPYFGTIHSSTHSEALFLRDFTFINQGNSPYGPDGKINIEMVRMLGKRVAYIQKLQALPYKLSMEKSAVHLLQNLRYIDDDETLYQLS